MAVELDIIVTKYDNNNYINGLSWYIKVDFYKISIFIFYKLDCLFQADFMPTYSCLSHSINSRFYTNYFHLIPVGELFCQDYHDIFLIRQIQIYYELITVKTKLYKVFNHFFSIGVAKSW